MKGDPKNPRDWENVARQDMQRARMAFVGGDSTATFFWLEQTAEKAIKGWLIGKGWKLIKTHDLARLCGEASLYSLDLQWFIPVAERLTQLYFTDRYVDDSPDAEPDLSESHLLLEHTEKLLFVLFNNGGTDEKN